MYIFVYAGKVINTAEFADVMNLLSQAAEDAGLVIVAIAFTLQNNTMSGQNISKQMNAKLHSALNTYYRQSFISVEYLYIIAKTVNSASSSKTYFD